MTNGYSPMADSSSRLGIPLGATVHGVLAVEDLSSLAHGI